VLVLARDRASCVQQAQNNDQREAHPPLLPKRKKRPRKQAAQSSNRSEMRASVGLRRRPRCDLYHTGAGENERKNYLFIASKNSLLVLVSFILSNRNSIAASSPGSVISSSLRVPERLMLNAGNTRFSAMRRSRCTSLLPVPLNSS